MDLEEVKAYIQSRVGAVFYPEHAEKIAAMVETLCKGLEARASYAEYAEP